MMNPKEIKRLRERAPLPLIMVAILFFAPKILIDPLQDNLESAEKSFDVLVSQVREAINKRAVDQSLVVRKAAIDLQLQRLQAWLPPKNYLPALIDQFNALAKILGVEIRSVVYRFPVDMSSESMESRMRWVDITLSLAASYSAMRSFLQAVEGLPSPLVLTEVVANQDQTFSVSLQHLVKP